MKFLYTRLSYLNRPIGMIVTTPDESEIRLVEGWEALNPPIAEIKAKLARPGVRTKHLWELHQTPSRVMKFRYPTAVEADNLDAAFKDIWAAQMSRQSWESY